MRYNEQTEKENKKIMEVLEFIVKTKDNKGELKDVHFGINALEVQEIVSNIEHVTDVPKALPSVRGMFNVRKTLYSVIDMRHYMFDIETPITQKSYYILTQLKDDEGDISSVAFLIDDVVGILHCDLNKIQKADGIINSSEKTNVKGIFKIDDRLITLIDFRDVIKRVTLPKINKEEFVEEIEVE